MKISYIHGVCVKHDAISNSIKDEITWLSEKSTNEVRFYGYACDHIDLPFYKVSEINEIAFDQHFQASDLVVFHFGVFFPFFNLLPIVPVGAKKIVIFHNITPKKFVPTENHPVIEKSLQQMSNMVFADHIGCDSQTNLDVLKASGINTPATVLSLAINSDIHPMKAKPSANDQIVRLAFVGRFVKSKGPAELLKALRGALQLNPELSFKLDMIGNLSFSDLDLVKELRETLEQIHDSYGNRIKITIHGNASNDMKNDILRNADIFVLPTYHEGFCVPILEALGSGCQVITYENSNTPAISGGLSKLVETGNVGALSDAIGELALKVLSVEWSGTGKGSYIAYRHRVMEYVKQFSPEITKERFLNFIRNIMCS